MFNNKDLTGIFIAIVLATPVAAAAQTLEARLGISPAQAAGQDDSASLQKAPPGAMRLGAATFAPRGYVQFCLRAPDQCGLSSKMTAEQRDGLAQAINRDQWQRVFQLSATSLKAPAVDNTPPLVSESTDVMPFIDEGEDRPMEAASPSPANDQGPTNTLPAPADTPAVLSFDDTWATLNIVNQAINRRITPTTDIAAFGQDDFWTLPLSSNGPALGNCKHYVLEKRKALVEAGFPAAAMSIAIVRTHWGETHAVLIVATDRGELVLDNLTATIRDWRQAPYAWLSRQTPGHPLEWATVNR